jgi:hypothetical protein
VFQHEEIASLRNFFQTYWPGSFRLDGGEDHEFVEQGAEFSV